MRSLCWHPLLFLLFITHVSSFRTSATNVESFTESSSSSSTHQQQQQHHEWAQRYCYPEGLRERFGRNQNPIWGDLDPNSARRLYKTLLPRALLELTQMNEYLSPEELAPYAFRARVAAKLYARERSILPARLAAQLYDGARMLVKHGTFDPKGLTYQQLLEKYNHQHDKILESSCKTNERIDKWVLDDTTKMVVDLEFVKQKIEEDVQTLLSLQPRNKTTTTTPPQRNNHHHLRYYPMLRQFVKLRRQRIQ